MEAICFQALNTVPAQSRAQKQVWPELVRITKHKEGAGQGAVGRAQRKPLFLREVQKAF